ncbi:OLC1v1017589C1 [Oldenlandia corymbosa var. corymbosa]|nr:OLC1v1017589C1 [Oldenlandia corymbosa var. corymbosa]
MRSFDALDNWHEEFLRQANPADPKNFPFILLGNKIDIDGGNSRVVSEKKAKEWCASKGNIPYFETSAKEDYNVDASFLCIAKTALANEHEQDIYFQSIPEATPESEQRDGLSFRVSVTALRSLFFVLGCFITASVIYTIITDGLPFRKELLTPWMAATLIDFYINILAIAVWVVYKESNWISSLVWIILLICLGSIATCFYIVLQLFKLSPQESSQDPIFYVLLRKKKEGTEDKKIFSVVVARVLFGALGCLMLGTLIYTIATDGNPFRKDVLTPWLSATLIDFYTNVVALSVWVCYKESSWIVATIWVLLLVCIGSVATSATGPKRLLNDSDRAGNGYERTFQRPSVTVR